MAKYPLYLITYDRGKYHTGVTKPYHWSYFIEMEVSGPEVLGIEHQLRGMPGAFYYQGPESVDLAKASDLREKLEIGEVDESMLDKVHDIFKSLRIDTVESSGWNCQNWALDGFEKLTEAGCMYAHLTPDGVRSWLKEA